MSDDLRGYLQAIYDEHGTLTPELVVEVARPPTSPLHAAVFDRPVRQAAEAWYRERAHELIRTVRVTYTAPSGEGRDVRAFHAIRGERGYTYEPAEKVAADPFVRELLLRDMEREWRTLEARYGEFVEFVALVTASVKKRAA